MSYTPCSGTGKNAVSITQYESQPTPTPGGGQSWSKAKTFGHCPDCGRTVMSYGIVGAIKVNRHKAQPQDAENAPDAGATQTEQASQDAGKPGGVAEITQTDVWHYMTQRDSVVKGVTSMSDKDVRRLDMRTAFVLHKRYHALRRANPGRATPATQDELWAALMSHRDSLRAGTLELAERAGTPITPAELDARLDAGETLADVLNSIVDSVNASKA